MMQAANEIYLGRGADSPRALSCLAQTFASMQKRLRGSDALTDSTLTIVVSLVGQQQMQSDIEGAKVHIAGLRRIVELRGGIDQLEDNLPLLLKICKMDVVFALQYGGPTAFFRDKLPEVREKMSRQGLELDREASEAVVQYRSEHSAVHDVLLDAFGLGCLFNDSIDAGVIGLVSFQEIMMSIFFRLLRIRSVDGPRMDSPLDEKYHTGLVLFTMSIFLRHDNRRVVECTLVSKRFVDTLAGGSDKEHPELCLWLMMMGGIWTSGDDSVTAWLFSVALNTASSLGLETWSDVRTCVKQFPWVDKLHDQPGAELWKRIKGYSC